MRWGWTCGRGGWLRRCLGCCEQCSWYYRIPDPVYASKHMTHQDLHPFLQVLCHQRYPFLEFVNCRIESKTLHPLSFPQPVHPPQSKRLPTHHSNPPPQKSQGSPSPAGLPDRSMHPQTRTNAPHALYRLRFQQLPSAPVSSACRKYDPPPTARGTLSSASILCIFLSRTHLCALVLEIPR